MKIKDARDHYYFHSGKTSDLIRQLGLAGIAVIWMFKAENMGVPRIPKELTLPLVLIVIGLVFDLLQYSVATFIWGIFQRVKENGGVDEDTEFLAPKYFNWPAIFFFASKILLVVIAYVYLLAYLFCIIL